MQNFWSPIDVSSTLVLAVDPAPAPAAGKEGPAPDPSPFSSLLTLMPVFLVLFYLIVIRPQQKERKQRETLLGSLKKGDRVVTIGGILGQVASISPDDKEVVLKVDDNTRVRFRRSAIQAILKDGESGEEAAQPAS